VTETISTLTKSPTNSIDSRFSPLFFPKKPASPPYLGNHYNLQSLLISWRSSLLIFSLIYSLYTPPVNSYKYCFSLSQSQSPLILADIPTCILSLLFQVLASPVSVLSDLRLYRLPPLISSNPGPPLTLKLARPLPHPLSHLSSVKRVFLLVLSVFFHYHP
jgi:hypothetical protein